MDQDSSPTTNRPLHRRGLERLDLMLLSLEALDYNGGEAVVWLGQQLGFQELFPNRVEIWKTRCHNPLRRQCRRGELDPEETDALIRILCRMADRLYPQLRGLLTADDSDGLSAYHWDLFETRFSELISERMNPRRSAVQQLLDAKAGMRRRRQLVQSLALGAGDGGFERLKASLMDGES